jgi:hypothetical protein
MRRAILMLLFTIGCVTGPVLATTTASHTAVHPVRPDHRRPAPPRDVARPAPVELSHELRSRPVVARTVEDIPGTPHHAVRPATVTATASETPRILDRAGRWPCHPGRHTPARKAQEHLQAAEPCARHLPWHQAVRRATPAHARRHAPTVSTDHRMPLPYAPTAPASVTAGPAVSSSNAAGPALSVAGGGDDPHRERMFKITPDTGPDPVLVIKDAPVHTPD